MDQTRIARTDETREADFDFPSNRFAIRGELNPEDIHEFHGEPMDALHTHRAASSCDAFTQPYVRK